MASYFKSYFQASSMPKRLLQYALSRLEVFDTAALDLENLDIAWGKNSTFEFRDVGLQLTKLESLIPLPAQLEISKARVLLLKITIPMDIYSNPISVEVEGVEGQLRVKSISTQGTVHTSRTNHDRNKHAKSKQGGSAASHARGGNFDHGLPDHGLPTAADLAQSFLQTGPVDERAELEAAMLWETRGLSDSVMSDDGEGELSVGTGAPLSLPAFLTRFLQGIIDRLQVKVHGITFNLDVDLPSESPRSSTERGVDAVTAQFQVDRLDIYGVAEEPEVLVQDEGKALKLPLDGKRMVRITNIRGSLISEASFFSSLARSSAPSSPSATHSEMYGERRSSILDRSNSSAQGSVLRIADESASPRTVPSIHSISPPAASIPSVGSDSRMLGSSIVASDNGRFDDAPEDDEGTKLAESLHVDKSSEARDSVYRTSEYLNQFLEQDGIEDGESDNQMLLSDTADLRSSSKRLPRMPTPESQTLEASKTPSRSILGSPESPGSSSSMLESSVLPDRQHPRFSYGRISQSQQSLPKGTDPQTQKDGSQRLSMAATAGSSDEESGSGEDDGRSTPIREEDLVQSQLFSHEDAESMYMSAVSHGSLSGRLSGGWDPIKHSNDGSAPGSPTESPIYDGHLDNLEHARKVISPITSPTTPTGSINAWSSSSIHHRSSRRVSLSTPAVPGSQRIPLVADSPGNVSERSATPSDEFPRISKQVFCLDKVNIYLPAINSEPASDLAETLTATTGFANLPRGHSAAESVSVNVPGAFSTHLPPSPSPQVVPIVKDPRSRNFESHPRSESKTGLIEIDIGHLFTQFDVSVGRFILKLISTIKDILKDDAPIQSNKSQEMQEVMPDVKLTAEIISLKFLERIEGAVVTSHMSSGWQHAPDNNVLLQTSLTGLLVSSHSAGLISKISLSLQKFNFGYAKEDIISFDAGLQMKASVRDLKASDGIDISVNVTKAQETTRCEIVTLPMHVSIDLQRLDETFSWFGGLSSVLNLGSSIASNATVTNAVQSKPKPRGVRFEAPITPGDRSVASQNKADIRVGGLVLDLIGTECSVEVQTSAIKVVSRDEGIGVFIQKTRLSGPHLPRSKEESAINVDISSTRIEYLPSPTDADLDRLLSLITPSKAKYDQDDDILLDTLLRQRKQGAVLRVTLDNLHTQISKLHELSYLPDLSEEVSKLATVAKYLPDDDRPGLLSLILLRDFEGHVHMDDTIGTIQLSLTETEIAQITLPALVALSVDSIFAKRNGAEELIGGGTNPELREPRLRSPSLMARMIGDEMEPVVKLKLWNLKLEYRVSTLIALLGLTDPITTQDLSTSLANSIATLTDLTRSPARQRSAKVAPRLRESGNLPSKPLAIDIVLRDCIIGLNPLGLPSKVLVVLTEAHLVASLPKDKKASASVDLNKASVLVIDDVAHLAAGPVTPKQRRQSFDGGSSQVANLCAMGFVSVSYISSAKAIAQLSISEDGEKSIDVELRDDLFVLESCADSTQTLVAALNGLTPPTPPSMEIKYRTEVIPVADLLASLSGDAFGTAEGAYNFDDDFGHIEGLELEGPEGDDDLDFDSHYYQRGIEQEYGEPILTERIEYPASVSTRDTNDGVLLESLVEPEEPAVDEPLEFREDHFGTGSVLEGTAHRWNSAKNTYDRSNAQKIKKSPLRVCVRDVHIIWNLFDGYDWQHTRDTIAKAVQDVESKAIEKRARNDRRSTFDQDIEDSETVIGDFLFNSIYIGIPANRDPRELFTAINQDLNDNMTETESVATTSLSSSPSRQGGARRSKGSKLRLKRSKHHKITFELKGVCIDLVTFPAGSGETQSSIDLRVRDLEIFDHVLTSTWRKFATYMQDAGERETGSNMIHVEILNVRPVPDLAASEIVLKATVLPLRLHVDQDALDFITRFFEFKDNSDPTHTPGGDVPFLQRVEVNSIQVKLDFKPKRVDYAGLRSGHTTEFMNFLILDEADMVLRHTIIYGISGFDKLGKTLNDIWMPDIKRNQLPGILAGLAPVRSLVNVGGGFRHLIVVPMREYKKDGRIVRSIAKGAAAFAQTTGTELVKLGAKVAIGMQTVLQGAEGLLSVNTDTPTSSSLKNDESDEERKQISLYANQPVGVLQGLRGGYAGLQRDLILARDAIIAVPGEIMDGGNAAGVLRAVGRHAPTVILRPAIGVAKAGGQILMGATNALDPVNLQRADAKYKKH